MIKIFRKARRKMLAEQKFRNYLVYAIGEIVLVVIGILIALAIDNHNDNRVLQKKEQIYLAGLKNEFQTSKRKLEELIKINRQNYEGAKTIITYISDPKVSPSEAEFSTILFHTFAFDIVFNPNNSLLTEMINSGSLKDLKNVDLRKSLTNWVANLEDISKQEIDQGLQREKVLDMFRRKEYSIRTILDLSGISENEMGLPVKDQHLSNLPLLKSVEFENNILSFILSSQATESAHYLPLMKSLDGILVLIDSEIKN